ncbi:MAG: hypothetical protein PHH75_02565 [Candidatus Omnitrophica bacterium]|nr:hypothetical protein [Candidatus Omnitrophota bacterium]MDD5574042.1 hypothetical protein [Candidatus Omnitrophota bacterium]
MNRIRNVANVIAGICFEMGFALAIVLLGLAICLVTLFVYR